MKNKLRVLAILGAISALEGTLALFFFFQEPSMEKNALLFGFSALRLGLGLGMGLLALALGALAAAAGLGWARGWPAGERALAALERRLAERELLPAVLGILAYLALLIPGLWLLFGSPLSAQLGMLVVVFERSRLALVWLELFILQSGLLLWIFDPSRVRSLFPLSPEARRQGAQALLWLTVGLAAAGVGGALVFKLRIFAFLNLLLGCAAGFQLLRLGPRHGQNPLWLRNASVLLNAATVFCAALLVYRATTVYVNMLSTPDKSYFDQLADAWLHGRLYLENLESTHDLTLYQGNWYVANPPLVALVMTPFIALFGLAAMNTVMFSVLFAALNVALVYALLEGVRARGWVSRRTSDAVWLSALFGFGTGHWYLGVIGKMWFMSQILTVTCLALAALLSVTRRPPLLAGLALGAAVLARPHILVFAPLLLGIAVQNARDAGEKFGLRELLGWGLQTGLPVAAAGGGLLFYNWLRFDNIWDYGYLTENVADFMAQDLRNYGTFHPHFIGRNLKVMLFSLPKWSEYCGSYLPSVQGLSVLLTTPALVFLAGSFKRRAWVWGAWAGAAATLLPLMLYYNTGAWQFGYKYLLDFIVPLILLLAAAAEGLRPGPRWLLRGLIALSIAVNAYGVLWWFGAVCRG